MDLAAAGERQPLLPPHVRDDFAAGEPGTYSGTTTATNTEDGLSDILDHKLDEEITWQSGAWLIASHSLPLIPTYLLHYAFQMTTIIAAASQLTTEELAGVSLGMMTSNIVGFAVLEGLATALDTLCSQAYGSGRLEMVGLHTVRVTVLSNIIAIPIGLIWAFSPELLGHLVPQADLALNAGTFLRWSIIGIPGYATFETSKRFMQAQNNFTAGLYVLLVCLPINIFLNWLLVYHLQLGIPGAALTAAITNFLRPVFLAVYALWWDPSSLKCWPRHLTIHAVFSEWGAISRLAAPATLMTLSEWMAFEVLQISSSYLSEAALAAQTFAGTGANLAWHIPFAASVATSTRLGQMIGAGQLEMAKTVSWWYLIIFVLIGIINMGLEAGAVAWSGYYLTDDPVVRSAALATIPWAALFCFWDSVATWSHGTVRGLGWQNIGSFLSVVITYGFGVPLALVLELGAPHLGLRGLWIGLGSAIGLLTVVEGSVVMSRDWRKAYQEAQDRQEE
ncbi:hypothetical protein LTR78_006758 [Recurvomyces mirabilis]|uniref:MATE efflux family protein n=1 Tax=Recurvomyces mirabilis TaxID=574656 RepID=A0AAE0WK55_9PEZI|nr:hypothetical protein LTR78_006758 [Recurvomyces mirabilis]KAK5153253.1 hypothetical protein LTS14_007898 [Recurvomyces mirabilis]